MNKYSFFIDTTQSDNCCLKIIDNNFNIINERYFYTQNNLIDIINDEINKLFEQCNIAKLEIKKIYLNIGPGSFTGCRVSVSIAKSFWLVNNNIQLYTINSLKLKCKGNGISLIDAKSNKLYLAVYENGNVVLEPYLVNKEEKNKVIDEYEYLNLFDENMNIDFNLNSNNYQLFELCEDVLELDPLYIKPAI